MVIAAIQIAVFSPRSHTNVVQPIVHRESSAAFEDALVVRTNCGEYIGTIEDGAFVFKVSMDCIHGIDVKVNIAGNVDISGNVC